MIIEFNKRFVKDFKHLPEYAQKIVKNILKQIEEVSSIYEITNCCKLTGSDDLYRIRLGDHRLILLLYISGDTVELRRVLSRGQVYKKHIT